MPPPAMASPKKQPAPAPFSTPAPSAVDRKPVVEAADLTPPAPEPKVAHATFPKPDSVVIPPDCTASHFNSIPPSSPPQEIPQSTENNQTLAAELVCQPVIHAQEKVPILESAPESIPAVEQQQDNTQKIAEDFPHTETELTDDDQQTCVSKIPVQLQGSSESTTERQDLSTFVESEMQNLLTTDLDKTTAPAEVEMEPNPKITQSEAAALLTDNEKAELTPDKLLEVTTNLVEPKSALISEVIAQGTPVQSDPNTDPSSANVKDEKTVEFGKQPEETQVDETQSTEAGETPSDRVDTGFNVEQKDIMPTLLADSVVPDVKNDAAGLIKAEPEAIIEKPALVEEASPNPQVEIVDNRSTVADGHTELAPFHTGNKSPPDAPAEVETKNQEKVNKENTIEHNVFEKVLIEGETAKQNVPETVGGETIKGTTEKTNEKERVVEKEIIEEKAGFEQKSSNGTAFEEEGAQNSAAADSMIEVKASDEKAFEEEETAQQTVEKANDRKPLEEEGNKAESSPAPSSTETGNVCPVIEMRKSQTAGEQALTATEEIPKEETQICKETGMNESSRSEESFVETVQLLEKLEEKGKPMVESVAQKKEEQTPIDTVLKAGDNSEEAAVMSALQPPDCEEQEKVDVKEPVRSVESVPSSVVRESLTAVCGEQIFQDETRGGSRNTYSIAEDQHKVEKGMLDLTDGDEKQLEKSAELPVKENEKLDKKEDESQPVAGNSQETISGSETSTTCDKDGTAHFDVGENEVSKTDEVSKTRGVSVLVSVPVAEPEIPVFVVSEQDKSPREKNTNMGEEKEAKTYPLGMSSEGAAAEVTIVLSPSSVRLHGYLPH